MKTTQEQLDNLLDRFQEWKTIFGHSVPAGYEEPKDRAKERKQFEKDIIKLKKQLAFEKHVAEKNKV